MSGSTRVSRYQKGKTKKVKPNLDLLEQEIVSGRTPSHILLITYFSSLALISISVHAHFISQIQWFFHHLLLLNLKYFLKASQSHLFQSAFNKPQQLVQHLSFVLLINYDTSSNVITYVRTYLHTYKLTWAFGSGCYWWQVYCQKDNINSSLYSQWHYRQHSHIRR